MMKTIQAVFLLLLWSLLAGPATAADRALIVGIEQYLDATIKPARGSERDAQDIEQVLLRKLDFPGSAIRKLTGAGATSRKIAEEFDRWLIQGTRAGDRVFFYYAGHGSYLRDDDGDEKDEYDETIVPYDALRSGPGMIRDDQFARWIAALPGRRIVMVFDSCHSGTISRSFGRAAEQDETARYIIPADSELRQQSRTRILLELADGGVSDPQNLSPQSAALIISAAGPMQTAHSMMVAGTWHGALTLALTDVMDAGDASSLPLGRLKGVLKQRIAGWQKEKRLNGSQSPEFEWSTGRLETDAIFGAWESVPQIALLNPRSTLRIRLEASDAGKQRDLRGNLVYYENETISYRISTNAPGFLYLLTFSQDPVSKKRNVTMLFPNKSEGLDNRINPPGIRLPEKSEYRIAASGLDITVALVTTRPLKIEIKDQYGWDEIFALLNLQDLQSAVLSRSRSLPHLDPAFDWQASSVGIFTKMHK